MTTPGRFILASFALLVAIAGTEATAATVGSRFDPADFTSIGTLNVSSGTVTFNTTNRTVSGFAGTPGVSSTTEGGENVVVYTFNSVSITGTATVTITGNRPIVILSKGDFTLGRAITINGGNASGGNNGVGIVGGFNGADEDDDGEGPGAGESANNEGGSGAGYGGQGGDGASNNSGGGNTYGTSDIYDLFGGSGGGGGRNSNQGGGGGAGGGAISVSATGTISIQAGGSITVNGGNGATEVRAGGGGGSGGSIVLSAPTVTNAGTLNARGGNGGAATGSGREGGGGGGGGRIAIFANTLTAGTRNVQGGAGGTGSTSGDPGSTGSSYTDVYSVPPVVSSITRLDSSPTFGPTVRFRITFSRSVQTVVASDLQLVEGGGHSGASIASISGSGTTRDVTVNTGTGSGTLKLNVLDFDTILDTINVPLGGVGLRNADFTTGQSYDILDFTPSVVLSGPSVSQTRNGPVTYTVTYDNVLFITLNSGHITLNKTGTADGSVSVSGSGSTRTVTISSITGTGTLGITVASGTAVAFGSVPGAGPSTTFDVDNTPPGVSISAPSATVTATGPVTYTITYTDATAVSLVAGNVSLNRTGTANGIVSVSGTGTATRTVTISSITGTGTIGISLAANTATDAVGNTAPAAGPSQTFIADNSALSVSIGAPSTSLTRTGPVNFPITYNGANTVTLVPGNITLNKTGTADGSILVTGSGNTSRIVTISGITGDGTLSISIAAGTASTLGGTLAPAAGPSATVTVDNTAPGVSISAPSLDPTCGSNITFTVTYTDANSVSLTGLNVTLNRTGTANGAVAVSGSGTSTRTVTVNSITGNGTIGISIAAGTASDTAGNTAAAAGPSATSTVDTQPPTISIGAPSTTLTNSGPVTYTVTYTGAQTVSLTASNVTLNRTGTANGVVTVSGSGTSTRTVTVDNVTGDGTIGISIAAGTADDNTCNPAPASAASQTFDVDNSPPVASISGPSTALTTGGPVTYTVSYTGADQVTLAPGDITLNTSGTATGTVGVTGSGTSTRTVTISGITGDGSIGITVNAGTASDPSGNFAAAAGPSATFVVDNTAPSLSIGAPTPSLTNTGPVSFTVTYTGADSILLAPGLVSLNTTGTATGTVNVLGTGTTTRTIQISGITGDGTIGVSIAALSAVDTAGNQAAAAGPSATFTVDNAGPTIAIGAPSAASTQSGPVSYTVSYTGASAITLANADIVVSTTGTAAGTATVSGSGTAARTVTFSGVTGNGTIGFTIVSGTATDAAGNLAVAGGPSATFVVDNTGPGVSISSPSPVITNGGPVVYTVNYTDAASVTLANANVTLNSTGNAAGTVSVSGSGTSARTVTISGITGNGTLSISVAAGTAADSVGNLAAAEGPATPVVVDNLAPSILIGAPSATLTATGPVTYTVSYVDADAITLAPGNVTLNTTGTATGTVSVSGAGPITRTVTISGISGNGTIGINVAAGTASDNAGNSAASAGPSTTFDVSNTLPSLSIGAPSVSAARTGPVSIPLTFAHVNAINMTLANLTLNSTGTATGTMAISGSGLASRTVTISGITGDGTLSISVSAGAGQNGLGDQTPAAGPSAAITVDNTAPGIAIGAPSAASTTGGPISYTVSYTGASDVTLAPGNVTLNRTGTANGTVSVTGTGPDDRTVTISGITGDGTIGISIAAATASDLAGNTAPAAGPSATFLVDNSGPGLGIVGPSVVVSNDGPVSYTLNYTNATSVTLTPAHISLVTTGTANAVVSVSGSGSASRTVSLINLTGDGTIRINVAAGSAEDGLGNQAAAAGPSQPVTVDNTAPIITILGSNPVVVERTLPYVDAGASAADNIDGNISNKIQKLQNVDVWTAGAYTVVYNVTDLAGNAAVPQVRTVNVTDQPEDATVLEALGRTVCRTGICVTINGNTVFTPGGSFVLEIDRPQTGIIPAALFPSMLRGTWFDVKPHHIAANNLGSVTLDYGAALAGAQSAARASGRSINENELFIYFIDAETGATSILDATINKAEKKVSTNIVQLGIYAVGAFLTEEDSDADNDLLDDTDEPTYGTDPNNPDTDGDGVMDGIEVFFGTDPLNPNDFPELPANSPRGLLALIVGMALAGATIIAGRQVRRRPVSKR